MRSQLWNKCKNSTSTTHDFDMKLLLSDPLSSHSHEFVTGISHLMQTLDRARLIYLHTQHLTAYGYVTTHFQHTTYIDKTYTSYLITLPNMMCDVWGPSFSQGNLRQIPWIPQCKSGLGTMVGGGGWTSNGVHSNHRVFGWPVYTLSIQLANIQLQNIELPNVEIPNVELPNIKYPSVELSNIKLSKVELPNVELPNIELPNIELPNVKLPNLELPIIKLSNLELMNVKSPNIKLPNVKFKNVDVPNVKLPNVKLLNVKLPNIESPNVKFCIKTVSLSLPKLKWYQVNYPF